MVDRDFNEQAMRRKIEQSRQEQAEKQRDQERREQAEANRRKPHCSSSWQDPAFCNRVLKRAEAIERARHQVEAGDYAVRPRATAQARWDAAIEAALPECGGNKSRAVAMVARQNPKLRAALVAEANR